MSAYTYTNWMQEMMARRKQKLRYSEETLWFPDYYIGWTGIGNCDQETSKVYLFIFLVNLPSTVFGNKKVYIDQNIIDGPHY